MKSETTWRCRRLCGRAVALAAAAMLLVPGTWADVRAADDKYTELAAFVRKQMTENAVPGIAVGILHDGRRYTQGFGITNVDHPLTVDDETLFQVGSITKTMTGTILMRLAETGQVDLDAPLHDYLPEFRVVDGTATETATIRHLLTHMGGWVGDYFVPTGEGDDALDRMIEQMADLEQLAPIGTVWSYNNSGYYAAGKVIENVTGRTFEDVIEEMVFADIGMKNTYIRPGDVMTKRFAVGHIVSESGTSTADPWSLYRAAYAAGGAIMDVGDMLTYGEFHLGDGLNRDGQRVMSAESLAAMQSVQEEKIGSEDLMGITWHISAVDGANTISHGGGTLGQISRLLLVPEHDFVLAVVTNANRGSTAATNITRHVLDSFLDLESTDPEPQELGAAELAAFAGKYSRPFMDVNVSIDGGFLLLKAIIKQSFPDPDTPPPDPGPPAMFGFYEPDRLISIDGPARAQFIRKEDGSIGWLRLGSRIHVRQE